jgi:hypothetical protein
MLYLLLELTLLALDATKGKIKGLPKRYPGTEDQPAFPL